MKTQEQHIGKPNKLRVISTNGTHGAHQGFSVEPGETYTFEIDLHRPAGMNNVINIVIWKNTGPSGAYTLHVLNTDGSNAFNYTATSSNIYIQIRQAGTYYLDNIRMYRTYEDTVFVGGYEVDRAYRYGFNSMERDNEIKGKGNSYDFGARLYDPRVGRWLGIDPLAGKYPYLSPYNLSNNNPIILKDFDGRDFEPVIDHKAKTITFKAVFYTSANDKDVTEASLDHWRDVSGKYDVVFGKGKDKVRYNVQFELVAKEFDSDSEAFNSFSDDKSGMANFFSKNDKLVDKLRPNADGITIEGNRIFIREGKQEQRKVGSHEVGHIFSLIHRTRGIMMDGAKNINNDTGISKSMILDILKLSGLDMKPLFITNESIAPDDKDKENIESRAKNKISNGNLGQGRLKSAKRND